jgi:ABC-type multidrug transport system ATPase subunit
MPELTVRENIMHAARIRLPSRWADAECNEYVDTLIACLGLSHVQNNIVGDQIHSAVSGGQRKRVSIGIELAAAPMALFLDEPTSGLDATAALSVMRLLKMISQLGVTIVCIIHQPRIEILESLDGIHLLSRGRQVYHGKASGVANYFDSMGFSVSGRSNIGDAVLDIISGRSTTHSKSGPQVDINDLAQYWRSNNSMTVNNFQADVSPELLAELRALSKSASSRGAFWHKQVQLCFVRGMKKQWYRQTRFVLEISVGSIAGLLIGLSLYELDGRHFQGIYVSPFELLSSAVSYTLVPLIGMLCSLAIGIYILRANNPVKKIANCFDRSRPRCSCSRREDIWRREHVFMAPT